MTIHIIEKTNNATLGPLWESLDIRGAGFSVTDFSELDEAYSQAPDKFKNRMIIQTGSDPKKIRFYDENADFVEQEYIPNGNIDLEAYARKDSTNTFTSGQNIHLSEAGQPLKINRLDGTPLLVATTGNGTDSVTYHKTLQEYEESQQPHEIINRSYADVHYVKQGGGYIAGDAVVMPNSAYVAGTEFMTNVDYFHIATGTVLSTGDFGYNADTGDWEGDFVDFGRMLGDSIEFDKSHIKKLTVDHLTANESNLITKHTNAELNKLNVAYQGKYGDNRVHYPVTLYQDVNGWTQSEFTGNMLFKSKKMDTGVVGDKVLELRASGAVAHKKLDILGDATYAGDTSQPTNLITREALEEEIHKEWFKVTEGTSSSTGERPTGPGGQEGVIEIWHIVTADSTTTPANELKILDTSAYGKVKDFSRPLRYKLVQQGGSRVQYWTVSANGWETNSTIWHLSATKVTGDNLVSGIKTEIYASAHFLDDGAGEDSYHGQGLGVPDKQLISVNGVTQSGLVGYYVNDTPREDEFQITLNRDEGNTEFRVIIEGGYYGTSSRYYRISLGGQRSFMKYIDSKAIWDARVIWDVDNINNSVIFWTRIDDGTSSYMTEESFAAETESYWNANIGDAIKERLEDHVISQAFSNTEQVLIDVTQLKYPQITCFIHQNDGSITKVKPKIDFLDLTMDTARVSFISPQTGTIIAYSL